MAKPRRSPETDHRTKPVPIARAVGQRIRALRKAADYDWDGWVEETGLGRGHLSEIERGLVVANLTTLSRMAKALDVTMSDS